MLDLACGAGRHSLAAALLGAEVTGVDRNPRKLDQAREAAKSLGVQVTWLQWDLEESPPPLGTFDVLLMFNYLDRERLPHLLEFLRPGGLLIMETFLVDQRAFEWGPTSDAHLLRRGEIPTLLAPHAVLYAREALEPLEGVRWSAIASAVVRKVS